FGDVYEGQLDARGLAELLGDLELAARVTEIRTKGGPALHSGASCQSIRELADQLRARAIVAAQVHYEHRGMAWVDTLMVGAPASAGYRLVRARVRRMV